jgi:hypothetical protein
MTMTLEWLPVDTAEADLSPPDGEKSSAKTPPHVFRVSNELWNDFGLVADYLKTDRSTLFREFMRWMGNEPGAKMPKRPASRLDLIQPLDPLPVAVEEIQDVINGTPVTRYVVKVDAEVVDIAAALKAGKAGVGFTYMETEPRSVSTIDRAQAIRMYRALTDAELAVVEP